MDDFAKMAAFQAMDRGHIGNRIGDTQGAVLGQINAAQPAERTQKRNAIRTSLHALRASGFEIIAPTDSHIPTATGAP